MKPTQYKTGFLEKTKIIFNRYGINFISVLIVVTVFTSVYAEEESKKNWELILGAGAIYGPVYDGSDKYEAMPIPLIIAEYQIENFEFFLSADEGIGIEFTEENTGIYTTVGVNRGNERDPEDEATKDVLEDTPTLTNPAMVFGGMGLDTDFGDIGISVEYYNVKADYNSAISKDYSYNAFLYSLEYSMQTFLAQNIFLMAGLGLTFMDSSYAEAYHSVNYSTDYLDEYNAKAGLHSVGSEIQCYYYFTEHIGVAAISEISYLLGDANNSPLTKSALQFDSGLFAAYRF